jgi:hypothetical protein
MFGELWLGGLEGEGGSRIREMLCESRVIRRWMKKVGWLIGWVRCSLV